MKKIKLLLLVLLISPLMAFRGCYQIGYQIEEFIAIASGNYNYGDNPAGVHYSLLVGGNGRIWRSAGQENVIFEPRVSGTTQKLNAVNISHNIYQDDAFAVGDNGTIVYSTNMGNNWSTVPPLTSEDLYGVDHNYYIYAAGDNGTILFGAYIGGAWSVRSSGTTRDLKAVSVASPNSTAIIVGEKGTILKTTDIGMSWVNVSIPDTTFDFYDINQKSIDNNGDLLCAVGSGGRIYKSTDKGSTWLQKTSGTTNTLRKIYFHTPDSGAAVGDNGTILLTTNGGETWYTDPMLSSPVSRNYRSVTFVNRERRTFAAMSDTIFYVSQDPITVGLNNLTTTVTNSFSLHQNYPNPFNPTTKIKFDVSKAGNVKLTVFNSLGQQVSVLVNKALLTGSYEYEFNANNMPSGVYFYKLEANNFSEIKKMVLVK